MEDVDHKILSTTNLASNVALNAKINGFEDEIPSKRTIKSRGK